MLKNKGIFVLITTLSFISWLEIPKHKIPETHNKRARRLSCELLFGRKFQSQTPTLYSLILTTSAKKRHTPSILLYQTFDSWQREEEFFYLVASGTKRRNYYCAQTSLPYIWTRRHVGYSVSASLNPQNRGTIWLFFGSDREGRKKSVRGIEKLATEFCFLLVLVIAAEAAYLRGCAINKDAAWWETLTNSVPYPGRIRCKVFNKNGQETKAREEYSM